MSAGVDAGGIPDQSRSGRLVRADGRRRIRGTMTGDRGRVHLRQSHIVAYANNDPNSSPPRNDALGNRSRPPGVRNPSQRAGSKPIRHGPAHWTGSRWRQRKSLTQSLVGCRSPLSVQLTPKGLFHQASLRSDRLVRSHGGMSSGNGCRPNLGARARIAPSTPLSGSIVARLRPTSYADPRRARVAHSTLVRVPSESIVPLHSKWDGRRIQTHRVTLRYKP